MSGAPTLAPTVNQIGIYTLTVINNVNGCTSSDDIQVGQDKAYRKR
ncbi:MAG: hypothetical protein IPM82_30315 [Saprospiraceae bacterium]|nr:hypothetical protein [Saprospiraceae bacterium]